MFELKLENTDNGCWIKARYITDEPTRPTKSIVIDVEENLDCMLYDLPKRFRSFADSLEKQLNEYMGV